MDEQVAPRHRTIVARLTIALGAFGILRVIPEVLAALFYLKVSLDARYLGVVALELVLAGGALIGGLALRRRSSWWAAVTAAWGAIAANSTIVFLFLVPIQFVGHWDAGQFVLAPRVAFYVLSVLAVPYVLWASFAAPRTSRRSRYLEALVLILVMGASWFATVHVLDVQPLNIRARKYQVDPK